MQSEQVFGDEEDRELQSLQQNIMENQQQAQLVPLSKEMIAPQQHHTEMVLNAFQCLLQSQCSVLIHKYRVKRHFYDILGRIWQRFLSRIWMKQGFGSKDDAQSMWIWNRGQSKLWQNNNFKEKWITPRRSVIDVLLTTESDTASSSSTDTDTDREQTRKPGQQPQCEQEKVDRKEIGDCIDLDGLLADGRALRQKKAAEESITLSQSQKKKKNKVIYTESEMKRHRKKMRLQRRRLLPLKCARFTQRHSVRDKFGWKSNRCSVSRDQSKRSQNVRESDRIQQYKAGELDLELSLILLFVGCRVCGEPLTMNDILCGAQKGIIPYLRAFEALPPSFRINAADPVLRRRVFRTDSNYVAFKRFFSRNEMVFDWTSFYVLSNLLINDLDLMPKIAPLDPKLMAMRYLRDCNIPSTLYPVTMLILQKYQSFPQCLRLDDDSEIDGEWRELAEFKAESVGCTQRFAGSFPMKLIFDGESQSDLRWLDTLSIMSLVVIAIQTVYRLDRPLRHSSNERPNGLFPSLSSWFETAVDSKWKYLENGMNGDGDLWNDHKSWTLKMTKDFIVRHYGLRPQFAAIHQFLESKSKSLLDQNRNCNRSENVVHGPLYEELMELCASRIGVKVEDLKQRVDTVTVQLIVVFEYEALIADNEAVSPMTPLIVGRAPRVNCNRCRRRFGIHLVLQCHNEQNTECEFKICHQCLSSIYADQNRVKLLMWRHQAGILRAKHWKCLKCQDEAD